MKKAKGTCVYPGISIGPIYTIKKKPKVHKENISNVETEIKRLETAIEEVKTQLLALAGNTDDPGAEIFAVHEMFLEDEEFVSAMKDMITNDKVNAEYAAFETGNTYADMFAAMDDEYMSARAGDIKDVAGRVCEKLMGYSRDMVLNAPSILVTDELMPGDLTSADKENILGVVTTKGSTTAHAAILLRTYGIPSIFNTDLSGMEIIKDGDIAILDAKENLFIIDADNETICEYKNKSEKEKEEKEALSLLKDLPDETKSGQKIKLFANIGKPEDLSVVLENGAKGIGLFRSEFLYMNRATLPSEEEQFIAYKTVLEGMNGGDVVIRTMDIGADKKVDCMNLPAEENPALGKRAIRICLEDTELFRTQLRALLRASVYGKLFIMYPMITSVQEIKDIKEQVNIAAKELDERGERYSIPKQGIMIETPAAAIASDILAKEVDFFSIGTNDLTQYTLALDRQGQGLDRFYDPVHPAILRLIKMTVDNAHANGIWTGICGELGSNLELTKQFVQWKVDELSMTPTKILPTRQIVRELD